MNHNIDLFELARNTMEEYMCSRISDEQFVYQAYCYTESFKGIEFKVKHSYDDLLQHDKMSDELEDYILHVLAYHIQPNLTHVRNYHSQWLH